MLLNRVVTLNYAHIYLATIMLKVILKIIIHQGLGGGGELRGEGGDGTKGGGWGWDQGGRVGMGPRGRVGMGPRGGGQGWDQGGRQSHPTCTCLTALTVRYYAVDVLTC